MAMSYQEKLEKTKQSYPFDMWREYYNSLSEASVEEKEVLNECLRKTTDIFDRLILELIASGENATETIKIEKFQAAIEALNDLDEDNNFIMTEEREQLCELTNVISEAAGLDPQNYGGGEGLASEWRDW